jgi:broad specificity phosphatase PhoE
MAILLMRHGPTELNHPSLEKDRIRGWKNVPLSTEGHQIAAKLADKAKGYPLHDLHSSDLSRAADTAHAVSKTTGLKVALHHALRPWDLGKLAGQPTKKVLPIIKGLIAKPDLKAPGGESFSEFLRRLLPKVMPMLADDKLHGIVTHVRDIHAIEALIAGKGTLDKATMDRLPSVDPGGMAFADESRFEPLSHERGQSPSAGS